VRGLPAALTAWLAAVCGSHGGSHVSRPDVPYSCELSHDGGLEVAWRVWGEGSIYRTADGRWHGSLSLGRNPDGGRLRRDVQARTQREVSRKLA
jgi:hypothetical protein